MSTNPHYQLLAEIIGNQPGCTLKPDDARGRATLTNPNGWTLTLTDTEVHFRRPDGAWAVEPRPKPKRLEKLARGFAAGNSMGIGWQTQR